MTGPPERPVQTDGVEDELRFHLESRTAELIAQGRTPVEARAQAIREFGDVDDARRYMARLESARRRSDYVGELLQDLKYALRRLRAAPGFAVAAVLTLAIGIGANMAIFTVVHAVLLRPLPYPNPDRLYAAYSANRTAGLLRASVSPLDLDDWRAGRRVVENLGGYFYSEGLSGVALTGRGAPRRLAVVYVTPGFFTTLGAEPLEGRLPREDELVRGGRDAVAVLTHGFWMREFGGAREAIGSALTLGAQPYTVIGVLPPDVRFPTDQADLYLPYSTIPDDAIPRLRQVRVLSVVARAAAGVTEAGVEQELTAIAGRLAAQHQENRAWDGATVVPLTETIVGPVRAPLLVLGGAAACVLLIACVNVAGLQLARAMGRTREIALRQALGARRGRIVRQLLSESVLLALIGGAVGIGLALLILEGLLVLSAGQLPRAAEISLNPLVIAFAVVVSLGTGLLFGLVPALRSSQGTGEIALRHTDRSIAGQASHRLRGLLVVGEVALAMVLVVGAGLLGRSLFALLHQEVGFRPDHLLAVQFTIDTARHTPAGPQPPPRLGAGGAYTGYYQRVLERVRTLPGVVSAAAVKDPPLRGSGERNGFRLADTPVRAGDDPPIAAVIHVSDGYFQTLGARVEGREFTPDDRGGAPPVVVVNEAFARRYFAGDRAVGKTLLLGANIPVEIIGVVNDIRQEAIAQPAEPTMYLHNLQNSRSKMTVVARTAGEPLALAAAVRDAIWEIDPQQPITAVFTFEDSISRALSRPRLIAVLIGAFGALGLALGAIGLYGVLASLVNERRREIGVRLALGAAPGEVLRMIVRRGLLLTMAGIGVGAAGALFLGRFVESVLYGVSGMDPATLVGTAAGLLGTAALASWLPARRAAGLDPVETLRD